MIEIHANQTLGALVKFLLDHTHSQMVWYDCVDGNLEEMLDDPASFVVNYVLRETTGTWTIVLTVEDEFIDGGGELTIICEEN